MIIEDPLPAITKRQPSASKSRKFGEFVAFTIDNNQIVIDGKYITINNEDDLFSLALNKTLV